MKRIVSSVCCGLALAGLVLPALAVTSDGGDNPFQDIVARNTFGLNPPPPPPDPNPPPPLAPPSQVKLVGFWEHKGKRQVFLKVTEPPKPGTPPKETSLTLDEGGRQGAIEVLAIDVKARTVKLNNAGLVTNLALVDFIAKTAAPTPTAPVPGVAPGVPMPAGLPQPQVRPAGVPSPMPTAGAASYGGVQTPSGLPTRPMRSTPQLGVGSVGGMSSGGFPTGVSPTVAQQPQPQQQLTPEEQIIVMEVERERTKAAVARGELPPLPPTPLTPPGAAGTTPTQQQLPPLPGS